MAVTRFLSKHTQGRKGVGARPIARNGQDVANPRRRRSDRLPESHLDLVPGVRDRVRARLAAMGIPADKSVSYVAGITQRSTQSVRRWFDEQAPGLPDLLSFARLCDGLGCSADTMIGSHFDATHRSMDLAQLIQVANCIHAISDSLAKRGRIGIPMQVPGDEMAPHLKAGDLVFVDTSVTRLAGNGIYALTFKDSILIRRVEHRTDKGIVLKCDNKAYRDDECIGSASVARRGLKILGKVHGAITVHVF